MRTDSQVLIFINLQKALNAGIKFFMSDNGVILTEGDSDGFLRPEFFERVENAKRKVIVTNRVFETKRATKSIKGLNLAHLEGTRQTV